jgi:hypothetical protein
MISYYELISLSSNPLSQVRASPCSTYLISLKRRVLPSVLCGTYSGLASRAPDGVSADFLMYRRAQRHTDVFSNSLLEKTSGARGRL